MKAEGGRMKNEGGIRSAPLLHPSSFRLHPFLVPGLADSEPHDRMSRSASKGRYGHH